MLFGYSLTLYYTAAALGLCYYRLGMYRDAEKQFLSSIRAFPTIYTTLLLAKVRLYVCCFTRQRYIVLAK